MSESSVSENTSTVPETKKTLEETTLLLEQYKLFVDLADRTSARRIEASKFYITLLSGILVVLPLTLNSDISFQIRKLITILLGVLGVALCIVWVINIRSYKQLNLLRFKVIHEMEQFLPFPCFKREWEILKASPSSLTYKRLSQVEQYIPIFLLLVYSIVLIVGIFST